MARTSSAELLLSYTEWLRGEWRQQLAEDPGLLAGSVGDHADGRFTTIGETIRHIFGAERRYVDRILGRMPTVVDDVSPHDVDALFSFGHESRLAFRHLLRDFPSQEWDTARTYSIGAFEFEGTPRKIVLHVLLHEIRHWAQIGTILRLGGAVPKLHDFLVSPVLGGEFRRKRGEP